MSNFDTKSPSLQTATELGRRHFLKQGAGVVAAAAAYSALPAGFVSPARAESGEIVVGFITSMSGPVSSLGIPYDQGMKAAVAFKNQVGGKQVKLIAWMTLPILPMLPSMPVS